MFSSMLNQRIKCRGQLMINGSDLSRSGPDSTSNILEAFQTVQILGMTPI